MSRPAKALTLVAASSQYASIAGGSQTGLNITGSVSIDAWVKLTGNVGVGNDCCIISRGNRAALGTFAYSFDFQHPAGNNILAFNITDGTNNDSTQISAGNITANVWHHIAFVFNAGAKTVQAYVDGATYGTAQTTVSGAINSGSFVEYVGGENITTVQQFMNGEMNDVRVWNTALSSGQVSALYTSPCAVTTTNCVAWWAFDNAYTDSINGNTLTGSGTPTFTTDTSYICVYTSAKSDSIMNGASRTDSIARSTVAIRAASLSIMNSASRLITMTKGVGRQLSDSLMNASSRLVTMVSLLNGAIDRWARQTKNTSAFANGAKDSSSWGNQTKNSSSFSNQTKL